MFRYIGIIIQLPYKARGQADLISVRGIALHGFLRNLRLGKLVGKSLLPPFQYISRSADSHRLINKAPSGQGVSNGAAYTGTGPPKGLDFRRMIMGFIFKLNEPLLFLPIMRDSRKEGAGIVLGTDFHGLIL